MRDVDVLALWHCGFFDAPLSGICLFEERICWFEIDGDPHDNADYLLYDLTDAEARHELTSHLLFERYVGLHTCNHASLDGKRQHGAVRPQASWDQFYDRELSRNNYRAAKEPIARIRKFFEASCCPMSTDPRERPQGSDMNRAPLKRAPAWWRRLRALVQGYFWMPCPRCDEMFAGYEASASVTFHRDGADWAVCPLCVDSTTVTQSRLKDIRRLPK